ncbi:MAG: DUF6056 family protein, partial [Defluviitaleaceae bacterium]|nr:DUF6056 family protein [Defluviitaleaceae bacterium]
MDFVRRRGFWIFSVGFLVGLFVFYRFVFMASDDFGYGIVHLGGFGFDFHVYHYQMSNGRAVVHLLYLSALMFGADLWRIVAPFVVFLAVFFAAKSTGRGAGEGFFGRFVATSLLFLSFHVYLMREVVFWMGGMFNYLYPMLMLFLGYYLFEKALGADFSALSAGGKVKYAFLPVVMFFSTASMEQIGGMALGALIVRFAAHIFEGRGIRFLHIAAMIAAVAGFLSVVLAPGILNRMDYEGADISLAHISGVLGFFITPISSRLFLLLLTISIMALLIYYIFVARKSLLKRIIDTICLGLLFAGVAAFVFIDIEAIYSGDAAQAAVFIAAVLGYFAIVTYAAASFYFTHKNATPIAFFAAAVAGQLSLVIADLNFYRASFGSLFLFIPIIIIIWSAIGKDFFANKKVFAIARYTAFVVLGVAAVANFGFMFRGYVINAPIHQHNIEITAYIAQNYERLRAERTTLEDLIRPLYNSRYAYDEIDGRNWFIGNFMYFHGIYGLIPANSLNATWEHQLFVNGQLVGYANSVIWL